MKLSPLLILACYGSAFAAVVDLDHDGVVGNGDMAVLSAAWGDNAEGDVNGDGKTDSGDFAIVLAAWGQEWIHSWTLDGFGPAPGISLQINKIEWVRELPFSHVEIGTAAATIEASSHVVWWVHRLSAKGWSGPVYISESVVIARQWQGGAAPLAPPLVQWVVVVGEEIE